MRCVERNTQNQNRTTKHSQSFRKYWMLSFQNNKETQREEQKKREHSLLPYFKSLFSVILIFLKRKYKNYITSLLMAPPPPKTEDNLIAEGKWWAYAFWGTGDIHSWKLLEQLPVSFTLCIDTWCAWRKTQGETVRPREKLLFWRADFLVGGTDMLKSFSTATPKRETSECTKEVFSPPCDIYTVYV